ncbi:hypothetical protein BY996DRAFT_6410835 [Phakopsora pachyrhizi]|nr:hypothetical protein BY996DRAFT_6410835 [Phakopsora pachyrhizi]
MSQLKRVTRTQPEVILKSGQKSIDAKPPISHKSISKKASRYSIRQNLTTNAPKFNIAHQSVSECDEVNNNADDEGTAQMAVVWKMPTDMAGGVRPVPNPWVYCP